MPAAWTTTRRRIIKRDGGICQLQLPGCTHVATSADHIIPASKGGTDEDHNLQASCLPCNLRKGVG
jgi:5-methylcytosine-specific restriction endonuclease McrA